MQPYPEAREADWVNPVPISKWKVGGCRLAAPQVFNVLHLLGLGTKTGCLTNSKNNMNKSDSMRGLHSCGEIIQDKSRAIQKLESDFHAAPSHPSNIMTGQCAGTTSEKPKRLLVPARSIFRPSLFFGGTTTLMLRLKPLWYWIRRMGHGSIETSPGSCPPHPLPSNSSWPFC